jgi:hypothetical protein
MARAMSLEDARLMADVLGNEHILGEYPVEDLMRIAAVRHDLLVRIRKAEKIEREEMEREATA